MRKMMQCKMKLWRKANNWFQELTSCKDFLRSEYEMEKIIEEFVKTKISEDVVCNEFSLQHELGIF